MQTECRVYALFVVFDRGITTSSGYSMTEGATYFHLRTLRTCYVRLNDDGVIWWQVFVVDWRVRFFQMLFEMNCQNCVALLVCPARKTNISISKIDCSFTLFLPMTRVLSRFRSSVVKSSNHILFNMAPYSGSSLNQCAYSRKITAFRQSFQWQPDFLE